MSSMVAPATEFPVARCAACAREALCYVDLAADDAQVIRCVECATAVDAATVHWLTLAELEEVGYGFVLPEGGCGRPGCGGGRCGRASPDEDH